MKCADMKDSPEQIFTKTIQVQATYDLIDVLSPYVTFEKKTHVNGFTIRLMASRCATSFAQA